MHDFTNDLQLCLQRINTVKKKISMSRFNKWHTMLTYKANFYWHTHDFGHAYLDTYTHFFPTIFQNFQKFSGSYNLILFKNLLLHI